MIYRALISLTLFVCLSSLSVAQTSSSESSGWQSLASLQSNDVIAVGDIISVTVRNVPDLSGQYIIDENGHTEFLLLGKIVVNKYNPDDLADVLEVLYEQKYLNNPAITVSFFRGALAQISKPDQSPNESLSAVNNSTEVSSKPLIIEQAFQDTDFLKSGEVIETTPHELNLISEPDQDTSNLNISALQSDRLESLEATDWRLVNAQEEFISFLNDGEIVGTAGCHHYFGSYTEANGRIDIHNITSASVECDASFKPQEFLSTLKSASSYIIADEKLMLIDREDKVLLVFKSGLF